MIKCIYCGGELTEQTLNEDQDIKTTWENIAKAEKDAKEFISKQKGKNKTGNICLACGKDNNIKSDLTRSVSVIATDCAVGSDMMGKSLDKIIDIIQAISPMQLLHTKVNASDMLAILITIREEIKRSCSCTHTK